jgi:RND family efflux transporter MFP subunit
MNAAKHVILCLFASAVAVAGCSNKSAPPQMPAVVTGLAVARAHIEKIPNSVYAVGTVREADSTVLSSQITGRVISVAVHEGDSVRTGQTLIVLGDAQARADLERAHAAVTSSEDAVRIAERDALLAKSNLTRYEYLRERKSVSPQEFDEINRRSEAAAARLEAARSQLRVAQAAEVNTRADAGYARIRAPFSGLVTARNVDPGTLATLGTPLLELKRTGGLQLYTTVDESFLASLRTGRAVAVEISGLSSRPLHGRVAEVVSRADPASHSLLVKIDLPPMAGLRSGMFGKARIGKARRYPVLAIPQTALVTRGSLNGVWVLNEYHIASLRYVTLGVKKDGDVEVLSGLRDGELVVLSPSDRELAGKQVEVRQ